MCSGMQSTETFLNDKLARICTRIIKERIYKDYEIGKKIVYRLSLFSKREKNLILVGLTVDRKDQQKHGNINSPAAVNRSTHVILADCSAIFVRVRSVSAYQHCPALSVRGKQASRAYRVFSFRYDQRENVIVQKVRRPVVENSHARDRFETRSKESRAKSGASCTVIRVSDYSRVSCIVVRMFSRCCDSVFWCFVVKRIRSNNLNRVDPCQEQKRAR